MVENVCRNCKHWGTTYPSDRAPDSKYLQSCSKIQAELDVQLDQGSGWDAGGAFVDYVETKPSFGCILFDVFVAESNASVDRAASAAPIQQLVGLRTENP